MFLEKMGIYGMGTIEKAILAGLVTGDPLLLIGAHGTAKTTLCAAIAAELRLKFMGYDASKALFEDMIGFPDPSSIASGEIKYVPTKLSLWDKEFILVDEISRARAEMQNKWLEVIRGRQVMGIKAAKLKYVFAAMNPTSYAGAYPLDEALAGRFAFIITVPEASGMNEGEIRSVINNMTEDDGRAFRGEKKSLRKTVGLAEFVDKARLGYESISLRFGTFIDDYLVRFLQHAAGRNIKIDGRRMGMLKRNICAYLAVEECSGEKLKDGLVPHGLIYKIVKFSMPFEAFEADIPAARIKCIHDMACDSMESAGAVDNAVFSINTLADIDSLQKTDLKGNNYIFVTNAITRLIEKTVSRDNVEDAGGKIFLLKMLASSVCAGKAVLSPNDQERVMEAFARVCFLKTTVLSNFGRIVWSYADMISSLGISNEKKDAGFFKNGLNMMPGRFVDADYEKLKSIVKSIREGENYHEVKSA